jgi:hypothetical protein
VADALDEDGGALADGLIERGIVIAHERSPWKPPPTTISAWRSSRRLVDVVDAALCRVR